MFSFLIRRVLPLAARFVFVALLIWFAGPYFAFADVRPLESDTARLVAIAVVAGGWLASVAVTRLRVHRASGNFLAAVVQQGRAAPAQPSAEASQLRERFEAAVAILKQQRGRTLYDLPWYVFIGAPGSGKTTALINSGLKFPLEQRTGKGALRGVGGTRNCDWWFTDEAVFLDTAGRYTTQDSDTAADSAGWTEFIDLLRKYRQRRPVNGVILTLSAEDLVTQGQQAREAHVAAARHRLDELGRQLGIQLPVYVMVTKCDLIAGFTEYFDDLARDARAQVWGVTFPYESTVGGEAEAQFPAEFDALIRRLNERVFARLQDERDARRRARIFGFPQQMAALREVVAQFLTEAFAPTRFDQQPLLRGVYFTSGTQEGTPIDRLLVAIGRDFAIRSDTVAAPGGRGKAYFIERLLKDVLIAESGLAGINRRLELQSAGVHAARYAAMALVTVLGIMAFSVSYGRNQRYLAEVGADVATLRQVPPVPSEASLDAVLQGLDAVSAVADSANRYRNRTPWSMRWGLYQGTSLGNAARDAYARQLDSALLPRLTARFRDRLTDYASEPEKLYEYLKAYLMLGQPEHLDKAHLTFLADIEWKAIYAGDPERAASVTTHFHRLLDQATLRPMVLDPVIIAQARSTIRQASIPRLIYSRLKLTYANDAAHALRLDLAAGVGADRLLRRKSGASLSEPVPSLLTAAVFKDVTSKDMGDLIKQFSGDSWVWGKTSLSLKDSAQITADVTDVYEADYIAAWDALLDDIELASFTDPADALATLAGPTSPLRGLLRTVDANTFLVKPHDPSNGALSSAQEALGKLLAKGRDAAGIPTVSPGSRITAHFASIHQLVAGEPGAAPIDRVLGLVGQIAKQLLTVGAGAGQTRSLDAVEDPQLGAQLRLLHQEASALPPAVRSVVGQVAARTSGVVISGATSELESRYRQDVLSECNAIVAGRYPFAASSATDVSLDDFGRLFAYDGVFDTFFKTNLQKLVDTSRTPWSWRPGSVGLSSAMLRPFEAAARLREMFFSPGSRKPELRFTITVTDVDAMATGFAIEIDGQRFENRHDPERARPAIWPGPNPGVAAATFEDRSGSRPYKDFPGAWGWFRLVSFGQAQPESDVRSVLRFGLGGHTARVHVEASTIHNPYANSEWQRFRCAY
jgi:type VI secretion system protein ImpL